MRVYISTAFGQRDRFDLVAQAEVAVTVSCREFSLFLVAQNPQTNKTPARLENSFRQKDALIISENVVAAVRRPCPLVPLHQQQDLRPQVPCPMHLLDERLTPPLASGTAPQPATQLSALEESGRDRQGLDCTISHRWHRREG